MKRFEVKEVDGCYEIRRIETHTLLAVVTFDQLVELQESFALIMDKTPIVKAVHLNGGDKFSHLSDGDAGSVYMTISPSSSNRLGLTPGYTYGVDSTGFMAKVPNDTRVRKIL